MTPCASKKATSHERLRHCQIVGIWTLAQVWVL